MNTSPSKPHFFKFILPGFENGLKIPTYFYQNVLTIAVKRIDEALLKRNGREWRVSVLNEHFVGHGWRIFAQKNDLKACCFVTFQHLGNMVFEVAVFDGVTQCKKESRSEASSPTKPMKKSRSKPMKKSRFEASSSTKSPMKKKSISESGMLKGNILNPCYTSTIRHYSSNGGCANIPLSFARENGLVGKQKMILMDRIGRRLRVNLRYDYSHLCIFFRDGLGIQVGDSYRFELVENGQVPLVRFTLLSPHPNN